MNAVREYTIVAVVIRRRSEVLLVGQALESGGTGWSLPAGEVKPYESLFAAAAREVKEETGLELDRLTRLAYAVQVNRPSHGDRALALIFEAEASGNLAVDDPDGDIVEAEFVELPAAIARLADLPWRFMHEPAVDYLSGNAPVGACWTYDEDRRISMIGGGGSQQPDDLVMLLDGYVPVIDLGLTRPRDAARRAAVARALGRACQSSGFLVVVGHGVPEDTIQAMYRETTLFFRQPEEIKSLVSADHTDPLLRGYVGGALHQQFCANRLGEPGSGSTHLSSDSRLFEPNRWPASPGFREAYLRYYAAVEHLSRDLMRLFAVALELPETWFDDKFHHHMTPLTTNYYPPQLVAPEAELRNEAHRDWGAVTVLYQDDAPGGLQVLDRAQEWVDVPPVPGSFVVNLGRLMSMWTNDHWASTLHRVVNPPRSQAHRDRISIAFFYHPNPDVTIVGIPTVGTGQPPVPQRPTLSGEYFTRMARRAYLTRRIATRTGSVG